jgi:energy-converting hydrogenase Eha subunit A
MQVLSIAQLHNSPITQFPTPVLHIDNFRMVPSLETSADRGIYILGAVLGACAGLLDVKFGDLLLTALFVLAATMLLGALRPQRPWRWTLTVAAFVPLVQLAAYAVLSKKPDRAQVYESFLGFLTGIAGAYGGATARRGWGELFEK